MTAIFALLSSRAWIAVGLVLALTGSAGWIYKTGRSNGAASVQTKWDADKQRVIAEQTKRAAAVEKTENDLRAAMATKEKESNEKLSAIDARLRSTVASLRIARKPRPASGSVSAPARDCAGATGAELSDSDGAFLARESARADRAREALAACYGQYERGKLAIDQFNDSLKRKP